jgi:hypothetical protein
MSDTEDIEDLRFQLEGTIGELENALSRERTLLKDQEEYRICVDNLHAEIERLRAERDEARRHCCEYAAIVAKADTVKAMETGRFHEVKIKHMRDMGWDCFKEASE